MHFWLSCSWMFKNVVECQDLKKIESKELHYTYISTVSYWFIISDYKIYGVSCWTITYSNLILSGVSQQLLEHVKTSTFPNSIGACSPLASNFKHGIIVGRTWSSQISSLLQYWHLGICSVSGAVRSGIASREYLK